MENQKGFDAGTLNLVSYFSITLYLSSHLLSSGGSGLVENNWRNGNTGTVAENERTT